MTVLGSAEIMVNANMAGFESEVEAGSAPAFTKLGTEAEEAGGAAGVNIRKGVTDETGGLEDDLAKDGERGGAALGGGLEKGTGGISSMLGSLGVPASLLGGWGALGVGVAGVGLAAIDLGEKMEDSETKIATASGSSVKAADAIGNAMLGTAGKSEFSGQTQAAAYAAVAGQLKATEGQVLTTGQAMQVMDAAGELATAKQIDLGTATTTVAATMQAFQLSTAQAADASNILFNVSNATGQGVDAVGGSLDKMRSKLGALSPDLASLASDMLDLQNNGITGKSALTGMTGIMNGLQAAAVGTTKAGQLGAWTLASYGLSATQANGQLTPMSTLITALGPKFATMTQSAQVAAAANIVGASGAKAFAAAVDGGTPVMDKSAKAATQAGTAHAAAAKESATLGVEWKTLKATGDDWFTTLGVKIIPVLEKVLAAVMKVVAGFVKDWPEISKAIETGFNLVKPLIEGFIDTVKGIVEILQGVIQFVDGVFTGHWEKAWGGIQKIFAGAVEFLKGKVIEMLAPFKLFEPALKDVEKLVDQLVSLLHGYWSEAANDVTSFVSSVIGFFTGLWHTVTSGVSSAVSDVVGWFAGLPGKVGSAIAGFYSTAFGILLQAGAWVYSNVIAPVVTFFMSIPSRVAGAIGNFYGTAFSILLSVFSWLNANVWTPIWQFFTGISGRVASATLNFLDNAFASLLNVGSWLESHIWPPIANFFSGLAKRAASAAGNILSDVSGDLTGGLLHLAAGGIVTRPTYALIGEAGPEAVIPLSGNGGGVMPLPSGRPSGGAPGGSAPMIGGDLNINVIGTAMTPQQTVTEIGWGLKTGAFTVTPSVR